ncbi:MAG: ABC transporter ATP-binding protein/permease [Defluviitaleaceae bacterium]|nr:ABC transporter ATP-binding protein/permease [Defluviitaleaceae bacterium]
MSGEGIAANKVNKSSFTQKLRNVARSVAIIKKRMPWLFTMENTLNVLNAVQPFIVLYFSARIIDELAGAKDLRRIAIYVGMAIGSALVIRAATAVITKVRDTRYGWWMQWMEQRRVRNERYAQMDFTCVEDRRVNEILADLHEKEMATGAGIGRIRYGVPGLTTNVCALLASIVLLAGMFKGSPGGFAGSFVASGWATGLLFLSVAVPIVARMLFARRLNAIMDKFTLWVPQINVKFGYYHNYIKSEGAGKDIRIFNQRPYVMRLIKARSMDWIWAWSRGTSESAAMTAGLSAVVSGLAYLIIGLRALNGMYSIGQVTQYVGAVTAFAGALIGLISGCASIWEDERYLPELYEFLDLPDPKQTGKLPVPNGGDLEFEFRGVSFKYPGSEEFALKNLSMSINANRRMAVVGVNGSGKTTMIKLLCRLYDPTEGVITLNGVNIREYDYAEYMRIFAVVFQDFKLPAYPLGQNVAAGVEYDRTRVEQSLEKTGFGGRMAEIGLDTALYKDFDKDGVNVSGGEAQKIALARAIYRDAAFVILDEPTSALDPLAEFEIYSKFDGIVGGKTAVYISHRLSSCRFCDDIAVFNDGTIVQRGGHEELLAEAGGKYQELWNAQARHYTGD